MSKLELIKIRKTLENIHKTLLYVFVLIGFFAFLYFGLLIYLFL